MRHALELAWGLAVDLFGIALYFAAAILGGVFLLVVVGLLLLVLGR